LKALKGTFKALPARTDLPSTINESLVDRALLEMMSEAVSEVFSEASRAKTLLQHVSAAGQTMPQTGFFEAAHRRRPGPFAFAMRR